MDPTLRENAIVEMDEIVNNNADENMWTSCSGCLIDRRATLFFSQLFISTLVLCFCIYQLINSQSCERDSLYSSILTMTIGIYLPAPRIDRR